MAKPQLGTKFTCYKCGTKFYDLKRPEPTCPKCSANQKEAPPEDPKQARERAAAQDLDEAEVEAPVEEEEAESAEDEELLGGDEEEEAEEEEEY